MLLIFLTGIVFVVVYGSFAASISPFVFVSGVVHFLLHVRSECGVLRQDLFLSHLESLEEEVSLSLCDLVVTVLGKILTSLEFEVLFVLNLFFVDVVLK